MTPPKSSRAEVLLLTPDFPPVPGGIGMIMHRLATHFSSAVRVVTVAAGDSSSFDREQPFSVRRASSVGGHKAAIAALNARSLSEAFHLRPSVVLSGHIVTSPAAVAISRALRIPTVQYVFADEMRARPTLTRFALSSASTTIVLSRHAYDLAHSLGSKPRRVVRIPPGVDLPNGNSSGSAVSDPTILTVARLQERYKGHDVLMRAMPLILARVPEARWVIVGEGTLRQPLEHVASSLGVSDNVHFVGSRSLREDASWFDRARVYVMPSRLGPDGTGGEGFGIVYLEANAHGLPVVAGNVAGALDAVVDGETGVLVDPTDHVAVADAVADLLLDRERAAALGRAGAERAREFAWPRIAGRVEEVLLDVAKERA